MDLSFLSPDQLKEFGAFAAILYMAIFQAKSNQANMQKNTVVMEKSLEVVSRAMDVVIRAENHLDRLESK